MVIVIDQNRESCFQAVCVACLCQVLAFAVFAVLVELVCWAVAWDVELPCCLVVVEEEH